MPIVGLEDETPQYIPAADDAKNPRSAAPTFHDRQTAVSVLDQQLHGRLHEVIRLNGGDTAPHDVLRVPREECPKIGVEETHRGSKQSENVERRDDPAETPPVVHDGESVEVVFVEERL